MKICLVLVDYWPNKLTMLPRIAYELAIRMERHGNTITILSNENNDHEGEYYPNINQNIKIKYVKDFKKELNSNKNDVVNFFGSLLGAYDIIRNYKSPMILNLYTSKVNKDDLKFVRISDILKEKRIQKSINRITGSFIPDRLLRSNIGDSIIITQGKRYERIYSEMIGNGSVYRIPHGIDFHQFSSVSDEDAMDLKMNLGFSEQDKIILYLGHSYLTRGIDDIIYSMKNIQKIDENIKLLLVLNDMPDSSSLNHIIKLVHDNLENKSYKMIIKYVERPELYYKLSDCIVLPYRFSLEIPEYPFVLLEAMASGKTVITSPIGSLPELIQKDYNGILVDSLDPQTLQYEILRLFNDDSMNGKLGNNAKKSVIDFDWELVVKKMLKLYEKIYE